MRVSSRRWLPSGVSSVGVLLLAASAGAAELDWHGDANCDRSEFVAEQVESLVGRSLADVDGLRFDIRVGPRPDDSWELTLITRDATGAVVGERSFQERSCVAVTDASAVAIAMTIRSAEESPPPASVVQEPEETTAPPPPTPIAGERDRPATPPAPASNGRTTPRFAASVAAVTDTGALPNPVLGAALGFSLRSGSLRLRAEGAWFAPTTDRLTTGLSTEFELVAGALLVCFERPLGSAAVLGCGGYELGRMSGEGRGVTAPRSESVLWQAARLEAGASWTIATGFRLLTLAGVALPVDRHEFELDGIRVHRSAFGLRAQLGAELSL